MQDSLSEVIKQLAIAGHEVLAREKIIESATWELARVTTSLMRSFYVFRQEYNEYQQYYYVYPSFTTTVKIKYESYKFKLNMDEPYDNQKIIWKFLMDGRHDIVCGFISSAIDFMDRKVDEHAQFLQLCMRGGLIDETLITKGIQAKRETRQGEQSTGDQ